MGGFQHKLTNRSKNVLGDAVLYLVDERFSFANELLSELKQRNLQSVAEYEIELLLRYDKFPAPIIVHGLYDSGDKPPFLDMLPVDGMVLPIPLAYKLNLYDRGEKIKIISPSHVDAFMGDIPRMTSLFVDSTLTTDVPEVDAYHAWTSLRVVQGLTREDSINRIRIYGKTNYNLLRKELEQKYGDRLEFRTWENENQTLVWALRLESTVMVFLFIAMTGLVSLCITSGFLIFFGKIKNDMASLWIMGASKQRLERLSLFFIHLLSLITVCLGLVAGLIFLYAFGHLGINVMPENFIDRQIPIYITGQGICVSVLIPYLISIVFAHFSLRQFKKQNDFLEYVRTIG